MFSNLVYYLFGWTEDEIEVDEKSKHQKYLVCKQICQSNIKLKPISTKVGHHSDKNRKRHKKFQYY